jgi:hypothetical protein
MRENCCGPFKYGTPGRAVNPSQQCFVDCCGNMCPPEDCCDEILIYIKCGSKNKEYECDCTYENINFHGILLKKKNNLPPIPKFDLSAQEEISNFELVCSIPCSQIIITLTTTGCCLYMVGGKIFAVGDGEINFQLSEESIEGCGDVLLSINGYKTYESFLTTEGGDPLITEDGKRIVLKKSQTVQIKDGEEVVLSMKTSEDECCKCCEVKRECDPTNPMWMLKEKNNKKTLSINKYKFIKRLNLLRKQKVLKKSKKIKSK